MRQLVPEALELEELGIRCTFEEFAVHYSSWNAESTGENPNLMSPQSVNFIWEIIQNDNNFKGNMFIFDWTVKFCQKITKKNILVNIESRGKPEDYDNGNYRVTLHHITELRIDGNVSQEMIDIYHDLSKKNRVRKV